MNVNTITLDVSKEPAHEPTLYLGQSDKNGTTLVVNMFDNGNVLDLTGMDVFFCMRTPGGTDYYQVQGTASGNVATFVIDETYAAGHVGATDTAYVKVDDGDTVITSTSRVRVVVLPSATDGVEPAPAYATLIEQFLEDAREDVDEVIAAAEEIIDYNVPLMTSSRRGGAKLGNGLQIDSSEALSLKPATTSALGGMKPDGSTVTVDSDGTLHGQAGGVTGVKGNAESTYRRGNVNLTPGNIGAAAASHTHAMSDITSGTLAVERGGTGKTSGQHARAYLGSIPMGTANQKDITYTTVHYLVSLSGFEPFSGARIAVKVSSGTADRGRGVNLNVNSIGSLPVYYRGAASSSANPVEWSSGAICEFIYDSSNDGCWHYLGNNIDGYEDYEAQQAIVDLTADVDALRDSVDPSSKTLTYNLNGLAAHTASADSLYFVLPVPFWMTSRTFTVKSMSTDIVLRGNGTYPSTTVNDTTIISVSAAGVLVNVGVGSNLASNTTYSMHAGSITLEC